MQDRLQKVIAIINLLKDVVITVPFVESQAHINGTVTVMQNGRSETFETWIMPQYPFQFHNMETIKFFNKNLIENNHVNADGSICVHTLHSPNFEQKFRLDFEALKEWMRKYLINKDVDAHYEHVVVPVKQVLGARHIMLFTDIEHSFKRGEFGNMLFSFLHEGTVSNIKTFTYILQSIQVGKRAITCNWNTDYKAFSQSKGIYLYLEKPPVVNGRFMVDDWDALNGIFPQQFVDFLATTEGALKNENYDKLTLLFGYPMKDGKTHWQIISIEKGSFPLFVDKVAGARTLHINRFKKQSILWGETRNCSYDYFFGRGALNTLLTKANILILGIGAVGSMVAQTLCRGGCLKLSMVDYDAKEPENVCRSEYRFFTGVNDKVNELRLQLHEISPFVETSGNTLITDGVKMFWSDPQGKQAFQEYFDEYDVIVDCTADNDLAYLISQLVLRAEIINISVTNHAQELVCAVGSNLYQIMTHIFAVLKKDDTIDLYNPTGCWSPTFKAGYNDIAVLVQFAIKQINLQYTNEKQLRSFYLSTDDAENFSIKLTSL